jgi:uncharacterized membrane protein
MVMETSDWAAIILMGISFAISLYAYPLLPSTVASHWDATGAVNGHMPAFWGAFLIPALSAVLFLVFKLIPRFDPLSENIQAFKADYLRFIIVMLLFLYLVHVQTLLWNLGTEISFSLTMPVLLGGLFFYLGDLLGKVKRNWFIGIRTPWTMSSDIVWDKTHKVGGKLFKAAGIISALSALFPAYVFYIVIISVLMAAMACVVYSYLAFSDLSKKKTHKK